MNEQIIPASFRDTYGFLFLKKGILYRQVNWECKENYDLLMSSGLYAKLVEENILVPHEEVNDKTFIQADQAYKIIKPQRLSFISYPYEWCFSQLKKAALITLEIQKIALDYGMSLRDASAYNIQFKGYRPVFIDTLSFEKYVPERPWIAYRQFCQHFLAPLMLMSCIDEHLIQLLRIHIDGIPLDLACRMTPFLTRVRPSMATHICLHARSQRYFAQKSKQKDIKRIYKMNKIRMMGLIDNLISAVSGLKRRLRPSIWQNYYVDTNYSQVAMEHKKNIIKQLLKEAKPGHLWDLGANTGVFSRIAANQGSSVISFDCDYEVIERNYAVCLREKRENVLPLFVDLINPSPAIGWENKERLSLLQRGPTDTVLALALFHHLAINNNVPFDRIANFLSKLCNFLIIEFVPKEDSQVQRMLTTREDIFSDYTQTYFEEAFKKYFNLHNRILIPQSERSIYVFRKV